MKVGYIPLMLSLSFPAYSCKVAEPEKYSAVRFLASIYQGTKTYSFNGTGFEQTIVTPFATLERKHIDDACIAVNANGDDTITQKESIAAISSFMREQERLFNQSSAESGNSSEDGR